MEPFDEEVENALMHGQDPQERIDELTRLIPVREGSRCTNDPLQIALARYAKQIGETGRVMPEAPSRVPDLKALASAQAEELVQGYSIMVRTARREDWIHLLELAYMRGFNESTMQRMNAGNQELIDALRGLVILPQVDGTHAGNRAKAIIAKAEGR